MIEIRITKEIGNYEPKVVFGLTGRQLLCVAICAPFAFLIWHGLSPYLTTDIAGFFTMIPAIFAYLFGWYKPYGMHTEKFLRSCFINMFVAPTNRKYKSENYHETGLGAIDTIYKALNEEQEEDKKSSKKSSKKEKQPRYKLSPKAYK